MRYFFMLAGLLMLCHNVIYAQSVNRVYGHITDERGVALPGTTVFIAIKNVGTTTDSQGRFVIDKLEAGIYTLEVNFIGYKKRYVEVKIPLANGLHIALVPDLLTLNEVVVVDSLAARQRAENALTIEHVDESFIRKHLSGNLMKTLDRLPGVDAIGIGAGQSKPVIRGLGFNRVVVVLNGLRHESQQWGADHGLEVDQFAVAEVEVLKGPASLQFGSDAIGGVIDLKQEKIPESCSVSGKALATYNSNNDLFGSSVIASLRKTNYYFSARASRTDNGDYRVPTDSIDIYGFKPALHDRRLRNTAGQEWNGHLTFGYIGKHFTNKTYFGILKQKQDFFANARGLEPNRVDTELYDQSSRDIHYPYQKVQHLSLINSTELFKERFRISADLGFQHNQREEMSNYVAHGFMPAVFPDSLPFAEVLERAFDKYVASANLRINLQVTEKKEVVFGVNAGYQDNRIDGTSFIIPAFRQLNAGLYGLWKQKLASNGMLQAGLRLDGGNITTDRYADWFRSPVDQSNQEWDYVIRAEALDKMFSAIIWSVGYSKVLQSYEWKVNLGKSFRMPGAMELAANGVNFHHFSYEIGDPSLKPETAYQLDVGFEWHHKTFALGLTPFVSYLANYIYLNPGYERDYSHGAGNQIYRYTQSEVFRTGSELHAHITLLKGLRLGLIGDYVFSRQMSGEKKGFGLPFSPPASVLLNAEYQARDFERLKQPYISIDFRWVARQNTVVPPEDPTPAYQVFNVAAGANLSLAGHNLELAFQVQNLLNTKYFNHTSYYRLINVPEPGRSFIVTLTLPFYKNLDHKI